MRFTDACMIVGTTLVFVMVPLAVNARVNVSEKGYYATDMDSSDIPRPADGTYVSGPYATKAECQANLPQNGDAWCNYYFINNPDPPPPWPGPGYYITYNAINIEGLGRFDSQAACEQATSALGPIPPDVVKEMSCDYAATDPRRL